MGRTPNDDRSDTMNPNNDAYWADQENRFGSDDGAHGDDPEPAVGQDVEEDRLNPLHALADPNLGDPSRHRHLDLSKLRWDFEKALATPASEQRDRAAATAELLRMAQLVLAVAREAAVRQGIGGQVAASDDRVELLLNDGRAISDAYPVERQSPLEALIESLKAARYAPGLAVLRAEIASLVRSRSVHRIPEIQEKIATMLARLPEEARAASWEDAWPVSSAPTSSTS